MNALYVSGTFLSFDNLVFLDEIYRTCIGILIFLHIILLLRHLNYNYHLYLMYTTIANARMNFISCITMISFGILAYSSLEYLIFGRKIYAYRNMYAAILSMIRSSVSITKLSTDRDREESAISRFAFFSFCIIINFLLINLLISILNETIAAVKSSEVGNESTFDQQMSDHVFNKVRKLFSFMEKKQTDRVGK